MAFALSLREFFRFYARLLAVAFKHSYGVADAIVFFTAIAVGVAGRYFPIQMSAVSNLLGWQIPFMALGLVFAVRLVLAPYWLYRERDRQAAEFGNQLATLSVSQSTRAKLLDLWLAGDRLFHLCNDVSNRDPLPTEQVNQWIADVEAFIKERFPNSMGNVYLQTFREDAGIKSPSGPGGLRSPRADLRDVVDNRRHRLGQIYGIVNMRALSTLD